MYILRSWFSKVINPILWSTVANLVLENTLYCWWWWKIVFAGFSSKTASWSTLPRCLNCKVSLFACKNSCSVIPRDWTEGQMGVTGPWRSGGTKETWSIKEGYGCKWPSSAVTVHGMGVNDGKVSPCSAQNHSHKKGITGGVGYQTDHNGSFTSKLSQVLKVKKKVGGRSIIAINKAKDG